VKLLGFSKQWLNPNAPFADGFLICFSLAIGLCFVEIFLKEGTEDVPPTFTAGALLLHWASITYTSFCSIENNLLRISSRSKGKRLSLGTNIMIFFRVILKEPSRIILGTLAKVRCGEISFDTPF
jgi:hypothetical protein